MIPRQQAAPGATDCMAEAEGTSGNGDFPAKWRMAAVGKA